MNTPGLRLVDRNFHATYGGSGIHRLLAGCHGQVRLARRVDPEPETSYQREGTEAHAELEAALNQFNADGTFGPPGKHRSAIQHALDYVKNIFASASEGGALLRTETRVLFPQSVVPEVQASGTLDAMVIARTGDAYTMHVIDYKHGAGEVVDADENDQLMFYAAAAFNTFYSLTRQIDEVVLAIVQPNAPYGEPVREYRTTPRALAAFRDRVIEAIEGAERLHAPLLAGEHCRFCPAAAICPEKERRALDVMTGGSAVAIREWAPADLPAPDKLDMGRLAKIALHAEDLRTWLRDVLNYAERKALAGELDVPGMKVVEAGARRRWDENTGAVYAGMAEALGMDPLDLSTMDALMPRALITVTDADSRAKAIAGTDKDTRARLLAALSALSVKQSSGALSLVPLSDRRPAVNRAAKALGGPAISLPAIPTGE